LVRARFSIDGILFDRRGVGHQNPDQAAELAMHIDAGHHPVGAENLIQALYLDVRGGQAVSEDGLL
jgi:hypothetical protein